ncbi:hypothetical protein MGYG_03597 [Nannizzia gypsea CBS 118893]|uniref:S-adenosylmethionine-dependent methyltransferase-like protein n=1 Tax=Arthroderma gypseum (strain ATCC MYA-4604 / CBS 118893) TaxID=535722 RepID=E4USS7_ARTGP|nr:hypothetical protein MGYG_03597 [Nannizzia gypsea CBS 118893]EFR00592.1 hypothetical protein MGYG_03597 [Nannizzia gypsea CBS 118893]
MQFFHKNKSQPTLLNSVESAPHSNSDHSISSQNHHSHHSREGSQQQLQQQLYQQQQQQTFQPAAGSHELPSGTYQLGQHSNAASYTHPAHAGSRSENFSLPLQVSSNPAAVPYSSQPLPPPPPPAGRPTLNLVPSAGHQPDHSIDTLSAAPSLPSAPHSTEASPLTETQPRKSRRSFFSLHSKDKDKDKSSSQNPAKPGRNVSVRKKISNPIPHPKPYQVGPLPLSDPAPDPEEIDITEKKLPQLPNNSSQPSLPQSIYPARGASRSSSHLDIQPFEPPQIQRVSTEPLGQQDEYYKGRPQQYNQYQVTRPASQHQQQLQPQQNPQFQIDQPQAQPAATSIAGHRPNQSSDQVSIPPRYSPKPDPYHPPRPPSQQSLGPPSPLHPYYQPPDSNYQKPQFRQSLQPVAGPIPSQSGMALERPTGLRQPIDTSQQPPQPSQPQQQQASGQQQQFPPSMPQGQSFKGSSSQPTPAGDREQETPPPGKAKDDTSELDVNGWIQKYEELQLKYNRVKRYYFDKEAQVQQLQNTVAHQRMSASRTVLDDNEYATRLGRLDGAINNLSFNIRKDWKNIPPWLQGVVNEDAHTVGTKEMTAVGRACLTRWIVDELFDRYFHPGLEPNLSRQLKQIERNVRRMGKFVTEEEQENHLSKVSSWRRTTLDGLGDIFQSKLADDHRAVLTRNLVEKLTASLEMNLKTPPPPGLENGVAMIVELAVGISANIPLESRDISIEYFLPGATITESHMKIETTLPPLSNPGIEPRLGSEPSSAATDRVDQSSIKGIEAAISSSEVASGDDKDSNFPIQPQPASQGRKKSVFGSLISKKPHSGPGNSVDPMRPPSGHFREREEAVEASREKENENRIRFAAFAAVEVRGKGTGNVIVKAPVYPFS